MPLPHPHGTSSGQIGHNAIIDTGDTPGSTGGKFVGFGEDGTSAIANRASWALSENINYVYGKLDAALALPSSESWTTSGGDGAAHQMAGSVSDQVWCGDATYLPQTQEGRNKLFSLLDAQGHELTDPTTGAKVVVRTVRNSTDTVDVFGTGWVTQPIIKFKTINPITGADVTNPYTIPDGTVITITHARKTTVETLPTDTLSRLAIKTAEDIPAYTFLQDGSRKMLGDIDMNAHNLANVDAVYNESGSGNPLSLISDSQIYAQADADIILSGVNGHINLQAGASKDVFAKALSGNIKWQDTRIGPIYLSKATDPHTLIGTAITDSLRGKLASDYLSSYGFDGNFVAIPGAGAPLTFTDGTATITWPAIQCFVQGEVAKINAGSLVVSLDNYYCLASDRYGNMVEMDLPSLDSSYTPIAFYYHDGVNFTWKVDARRYADALSNSLDISVGNSGGYSIPGCEFTRLEDAIAYATAIQLVRSYAGLVPLVVTIRVRSELSLTSQITSVPAGMRLIGEGFEGASGLPLKVKVDHAPNLSTFDLSASSVPIFVENLQFTWENASPQDSDKGCFRNVGTKSIFRNVAFNSGTGGHAYSNAFVFDSTTLYVTIEDCWADVEKRFVLGAGTGADPYDRLQHSVVAHCVVQNSAAAISDAFAIDVAGSHNTVRDCHVRSLGNGFQGGVRIGHGGMVLRNVFEGKGTLTSFRGFVYHPCSSELNNTGLIEGNYASNVDWAYSSAYQSGSARSIHLSIKNNHAYVTLAGIIVDNDAAHALDSSSYDISGNKIEGYELGPGLYVNEARNVTVTDNTLIGPGPLSIGIQFHLNTWGVCRGNHVEGGSICTAIFDAASGGNPIRVSDNFFGGNTFGASGITSVYVTGTGVQFFDNTFEGGSTTGRCLHITGVSNSKIIGNTFGSATIAVLDVESTFTNYGHVPIQGNIFTAAATGAHALRLIGVQSCKIEGNSFGAGYIMYGTAITLQVGAGGSCHGTIIKGNTFNEVHGDGPTLYYVVVNQNDLDARGIIISENSFYRCGDPQNDTTNMIIIRILGNTVVANNNFVDTIGRANPTGQLRFIEALERYNVITGNQFRQHLPDGLHGVGQIYCIYMSKDYYAGVAVGNIIAFTGASAQSTPITGIYATGQHVSANMNWFGYWTTGGATLAIDMQGMGVQAEGNFSIERNISVASVGGRGIVTGNEVAYTPGTVNSGAHATDGNVSGPYSPGPPAA